MGLRHDPGGDGGILRAVKMDFPSDPQFGRKCLQAWAQWAVSDDVIANSRVTGFQLSDGFQGVLVTLDFDQASDGDNPNDFSGLESTGPKRKCSQVHTDRQFSNP